MDSAGREIDPQFSSEEEGGTSQDEDAESSGAYQDQDTSGTKTDEEEDVVIVHNDVKNNENKNKSLDSDTELCLGKPNTTEEKEDSGGGVGEEDDIETCFIPESITLDSSTEDSSGENSKDESVESEQDQEKLEEILEHVEGDTEKCLVLQEEKNATITHSGNDEDSSSKVGQEKQDEVVKTHVELPGENVTLDSNDNKNILSPRTQTDGTDPAGTSSSPQVTSVLDSHEEHDICSGFDDPPKRVEEETNTADVKDNTRCESSEINQDQAGQFVRKCSQGFGFFVS